MKYKKIFLLSNFYLLIASMATSIFFSILVFLNSLDISIHYYQSRLLQTIFLSQQLDLYVLAFATFMVISALVYFIIVCGWNGSLEWLSISTLGIGIIFLTSGITVLAVILILIGQIPTMKSRTVYHICSNYSFLKRRVQALIVVYLLSLLLIIEFPALIHWIIACFQPGTILGMKAAVLETNLTYSPSSASNWIYGIFLFAWLGVIPILLMRKLSSRKDVKSDTIATFSGRKSRVWSIALSVIFFLGLSIFVGYYPYWHGPEWLVGTDVYWRYKDPLDGMVSANGLDGFRQAFQERHSVFLAFLFGLMKVTGYSSYQVLRYTPIALTVFTALVTFLLANRLRYGRVGSFLAGIGSIMWVPSAIGIFTAIFANWLAVILWIVFLAILIGDTKKRGVVSAGFAGVCISLAIIVIHPWTWGPLAAVTGLYLLSRFIRRRLSRHELALCVTFILTGVTIILLMLQTVQGWRVTEALNMYTEFLFNSEAIQAFARTTTWSPFLNPVLIVLAIVGILITLKHGGSSRDLIVSWLCVTSITSIFSAVSMRWLYWRVIFITPLALLAALGASHIYRVLDRELGEGESLKLHFKDWFQSIGAALCILSMSVISSIMLNALPIALLINIVLNLLLVTLVFHVTYKGAGTSLLLSLLIVVLIVNSGLRSLAPLLTDPHNITLR